MALTERVVVIKLLKIFGVLAALALVVVLVFNAGTIVVSLPTFQKKQGPPSQFNRFFSDVRVNADNSYSIQLRDVVATARADGEGPKYFNMDITVGTTSKKLAETISSNPEAAVNVIRDVMGRYDFNEVKTVEGKEYIKSEIKRSLSQRYNAPDIEDIYFEQFYQY